MLDAILPARLIRALGGILIGKMMRMSVKLLPLLTLLVLSLSNPEVLGRTQLYLHTNSITPPSLDQHFYLFNEIIYRTKIQPAVRAFKRKNDPKPLIALVKECIQKFDSGMPMPHLILMTKADFEEALRKLERKQRDVLNDIETSIIMILCMPSDRGVNPELVIGTSPLFMYLYDRSGQMHDFLYQGRGKRVELGIGEGGDTIFTKKDIQDFSRLVGQIPAPEGNAILRRDYDHLKSLLKLCLDDPELTLVLSVL